MSMTRIETVYGPVTMIDSPTGDGIWLCGSPNTKHYWNRDAMVALRDALNERLED